MSIINGVPFIKSLIASLSDQQIGTLKQMIDGGGDQTVLQRTTGQQSVNGPRTRITISDKGIHRCSLEVTGGLYTWNGYLIYTDDYCVLIYYSDDFQKLGWLTIDVAKQKTEYINEELSILELRNELVDVGQSAGSIVVADPTLAGTESELEGIEIDGTKYKLVTSQEINDAVNQAITGAVNGTY
jgi:hypothetical protein